MRGSRRRHGFVAGLVAGFGIAGAVAMGGGYLVLRGGISARPEPSRIEADIARRVRHALVPRQVRAIENPVPLTGEVLRTGLEHWADHCAPCHGNDGRGDTTIGQGTYPRAPDMRSPATQRLSDGELFYLIENGVRFTAMPAWGTGDPAPTSESWHLVHFIRHLPSIGPDDLVEMERMNPRTSAECKDEEETRRFLEGDARAAAPLEHQSP
ncbi:MAG: cytochrome c [Deltaproteobacteria bacterium]|nr:cytochrome c [Deltaproteobacteria bacterium]